MQARTSADLKLTHCGGYYTPVTLSIPSETNLAHQFSGELVYSY